MHDRPDFDALFRAHGRRVRQTCRYLLGSCDEADDAVQEVFLRVRQRYDQFDRARPFESWIVGVASHCCVDRLRRRSRECRLFGTDDVERDSIPSGSRSPLDVLLARERGAELRQAVADLPDKYRVPVVLAYFNELGYAEIARLLGIERSHVAVLLFRARQRLRRTLAAPDRNSR
ncbi:MAG: sigma-70 family RNA polymerase sigma factor [Acidobacteria bacterium]|nr:sigma-70 family RNA polymerase sigma factor [Acidobacteriota bacterium]MCY4025911.1 sigma-70 family RNA polymerase sigma factor [Acidobacteriota bacterium]